MELLQSPVKTWRESLHLSQADVAKLAGICRSCVSDLETGHRADLPHKLKALLRRKGVDVQGVLEGQAAFVNDTKEDLMSRITD